MKKKKILFACVPADGHFNPLTGLAKHLMENGYEVGWYSASHYKAKLERLGIPFFKFTKTRDITINDIDIAFPERSKVKSQPGKLNFDMEHLFIRRGPEYYEDIKEIHKIFPFELLVSDVLFTGAVYVKELMNIPTISIGIIPFIQTSKDLPPAGIGLTPSYSALGKIKQSVLRSFVTKVLFRKSNKLKQSLLDQYGIEHNGEFLFDILTNKASLILQSGSSGFEYKRSDLGDNVRFIGAVLPYSTKNKEKQNLFNKEQASKYERVVLITQGTLEKDVSKLLVPTLEALKNSNYLIICTTGGSQTQELRAKYPQENFIIEDFIPFDEVMPHADIFISNGGYGGTLLGIQNKLPMVVAGVHEGKNEICARIGYFKYGINLKTETPKPAQILKALNEVFSNEEYQKNINKLNAELSEFTPNELIEKYVAELIA